MQILKPKQNNPTCTKEITSYAQVEKTDEKPSIVLAPAPNHEFYNEWEVSFIMQETLKTTFSKPLVKLKHGDSIHVQSQ